MTVGAILLCAGKGERVGSAHVKWGKPAVVPAVAGSTIIEQRGGELVALG